VNESTPEASTAAAPTVDLHGVLVIRSQSEEKKIDPNNARCGSGFAYGIS